MYIGFDKTSVVVFLTEFYMASHFCHHLQDNYVDLSDFYVDLSVIYVDFSDHYADLEKDHPK